MGAMLGWTVLFPYTFQYTSSICWATQSSTWIPFMYERANATRLKGFDIPSFCILQIFHKPNTLMNLAVFFRCPSKISGGCPLMTPLAGAIWLDHPSANAAV